MIAVRPEEAPKPDHDAREKGPGIVDGYRP